jgi:hypothetical protein
MTSRAIAVAAGALVVSLIVGWSAGDIEANGTTQRDIQGRVESIDAASGTLIVAREFRGKTTRLALKAAPAVRVFACGDERRGIDLIKRGMIVSAFYEVVGADGVVNLIVVEPVR